jgi:hypothetical protein
MRLTTPLSTVLVHVAMTTALFTFLSASVQAQTTPLPRSDAAAMAVPSPLDAAGLESLPAGRRSPTEASLAGTWRGVSPYADDAVESFLLTLKADGSYTLVARMRKPADAAADAPAVVMPSAGRWSASGGLFVTVATQAAGQALDLRDRNLSAIYAIRALDGQGFSYQHLATGAFYATRRASADAVLTGTGR